MHSGKAGFAHDTLEHHAAGHAGTDGQGLQLFLGHVVVAVVQVLCPVGRLEIVGKRHTTTLLRFFPDGFEFFTALGNDLVIVKGIGVLGVRCGGSGCVGGHDRANKKRVAHPRCATRHCSFEASGCRSGQWPR